MSCEHSTDSTPQVEYREIPWADGYRVGDDGTVWSRWRMGSHGRGGLFWEQCGSWRKLSPVIGPNGYPFVALPRQGGGQKRWFIAHLVLEIFIGTRPHKMEACHDPDPTPTNCRLKNLRWDTHENNIADAIRWHASRGKGEVVWPVRGDKSRFAKKTDSEAREIIRLLRDGASVKDLAKQFDLSETNLYKIRRGEIWKHLA